jgi:hypothetical protein
MVPASGIGAMSGSITGSYTFTDPRNGDVRLRDAIFGSIVGGLIGGMVGSMGVIMYPILAFSPLAIGPYAYNYMRSKTETKSQSPSTLS